MLNPEIKIRPVKPGDIEFLANIYTDVYRRLGEVWSPVDAERRLTNFYRQQPDLALLVQDPLIRGGIFGRIEIWNYGTVLVNAESFVDITAQRQGMGTKLLLALFDIAETEYKADIYRGHRDPQNPGWVDRIGLKPTGLTQVEAPITEVRRRLTRG